MATFFAVLFAVTTVLLFIVSCSLSEANVQLQVKLDDVEKCYAKSKSKLKDGNYNL